MNHPWWTGERSGTEAVRVRRGDPAGSLAVDLMDPQVGATLRELVQRVPSFTPEWTHLRAEDAGFALVRLYGAQLRPLLERVNRLPEKAQVEFLRLAGIGALPGTPAAALLQVEVADSAPSSVLVPRRFKVGAQPADGSDGLVVFETERDLWAAPGKIAAVRTEEGRIRIEVEDFDGEGTTFRPFGDRPIAGRGLLIGIESQSAPSVSLALGIGVSEPPGAPPPVSAGGLFPTPVAVQPVLRWELFDGGATAQAEVLVDETVGLQRSGTVELRLPRRWRPSLLPGEEEDQTPHYWVRLRIAAGAFDKAPELSFLRLNQVRALAAESVLDEVVEHVPDSENKMKVERTPVLPGSMVIEIFEDGGSGDVLDFLGEAEEKEGGGQVVWSEVAALGPYGPNDRVFALDPASGEITFGDGVNGAQLPAGFRHVTATYRVGGGGAGAVEADEITTSINSVPFVSNVTNPRAAIGGADPEAIVETLSRGPQEIRSRSRAVTEADYELMAGRTPGADIVRAHAVSGLHPVLPGAVIPGVVGVFAVPCKEGDGPPIADAETLGAVARYLSSEVAPAGVEVVAAAPRFHRVRAEASIRVTDPSADIGAVVGRVLEALDRYFDPLEGGEREDGWGFGRPIRHLPLLRHLLAAVPELSAVPRLQLVVDGVRKLSCEDVAITPHSLLWPNGHEVIPVGEEESK